MDILWNVIMFVHAIVAVVIILLVLLQHGKGADMGAAFGGGSSGSLFGATGSANFLSRTTAILAAIFFATSLAMAYIATHKPRTGGAGGGVMEGVTSKPAVPAGPVVPGTSGTPSAPASSGVPAAPAGAPSPAAIPGQDANQAPAPAAGGAPPQSDGTGSKSSQIPK